MPDTASVAIIIAGNLRRSLRTATAGARLIQAEGLDSKSAADVAAILGDLSRVPGRRHPVGGHYSGAAYRVGNGPTGGGTPTGCSAARRAGQRAEHSR